LLNSVEDKKMEREWQTRLSWTLALLLTLSTPALGQQVLRGSIAGTIKDESSGALPGVTITVTSPALQVESIVRVSDERGTYQVPDLPAGTYRVTYELTGFATLVREGIVLTTGFAARVDADMKVATLAETVTVSGETPLVDVTSTRGGATVSKELIAIIPSNKNIQDLTVIAGGVTVLGPPMTGEITSGRGGMRGAKTYGAMGAPGSGGTVLMEGVKLNENEIPDFNAFEEIDVKTFGNTADIDQPGVAIQLVSKSGGNQFHGKYTETYQPSRFQANNVDAALRAQGVSTGNATLYFSDASADIGGRVIKDKLWFYGAFRDFRNKTTRTGYAVAPGGPPSPGYPNGTYGTVKDIPATPLGHHEGTTFKISFQPTAKHRFVAFGQYSPTYSTRPADRFTPQEANNKNDQYDRETKPVEWQGTLTNRLVADLMWGYGGYMGVTYPIGTARYASFDRTTLLNTGVFFGLPNRSGPNRTQWAGSVSYLPGGSLLGSHELQTGYRVWRGNNETTTPFDPRYDKLGELQQIYDTVGGVPHQPVEIAVNNPPVHGISRENVYAAYGQDTWRPTSRLTLNLGLRWERQSHFVPPQVKIQGDFGTSGTFPRVNVGSWNGLAPRAGVAFDLSGNGKTVVKSTYGWYNFDFELVNFSNRYNQNSSVTYNYRWHDLNGDGLYEPGEVNFDLNGLDFLTVSGATNNLVNKNLKLPHTHEVTASLERELGKGLSIRGLYVYKRIVDTIFNPNPAIGGNPVATSINTLRPYSVYDQAFTRRDPGPDGILGTADDGPMFTIYDYNPAYRGAAFVGNMATNADPNRQDSFNNAEITLTKRPTGNWFANTSLLATKNHRFLINVIQSPNDLINSIDQTWEWSYRLAGGYYLPFGINVSALESAYGGLPRQRTVLFRAADPAGGPAFPSSSTILMRVEPFGAKKLPVRNILNLRVDKDIKLSGGRKFSVAVDAFNALNANSAWAEQQATITDASGPTYGFINRIVTPRVLRFSAGYEF
jgi:carboxypeptidase family protein/TonB-dependent receptor-like protein